MSDTPTPPGGTPTPNQSEIDAALAAAASGAPAEQSASADPAAAAPTPAPASAAATAETVASAQTTADGAVIDADAALAAGMVNASTGAVTPQNDTATAAQQVDASGQTYDETAAAMAAALEEERELDAARQAAASMAAPPPGSVPLELPDFGRRASIGDESRGVDLLNDVDLNVKIELGRAEMSIDEVLRLAAGAVVELNKLAGDPVDVLVNDRLVARGEVLILNDNFCVRISEILAGEEAEASA